MRLATVAAAAAMSLDRLTAASSLSTRSPNAQSLLTESMTWMDIYYDPSAGYLHDFSAQTALHHETRSSAWYSVGLLARNQGEDVAQAELIIRNTIKGQYKNASEQWYGEYQQEPEEPYVGSPAYPQKIYGTWDANWRGFIATTFIVALEEFGGLISEDTTRLMKESLRIAAIGDSYRIGGVENDNLYPAYSNPSLMRAFASGWTGRRLNDTNMTAAGEQYAQQVVDLFNRANTLSEFNSGTYTGVSLFALTLWAKYLPSDSIMQQYGPKIISYTWEDVAQLWHPDLKNMAGPWDRAYGFDMNRYLSLMALHFWTIIGKEKSSLLPRPEIMSHSADYAFGPLIAVLADFHRTLVPADVLSRLESFSGEHTFTSSAYSPPYDYQPRNITSWLAPNISIGAETFNETVIGGPAKNQDTFNPAVIQWATGKGGIGFISLYATEPALITEVSPYRLSLTYPFGNSSSIFSFIVSTVNSKPTISGWTDLEGLSVNVSGSINLTYSLSFAGLYGGDDTPINNFEYWNFTYSVFEEVFEPPKIVLDITLSA
ncbi:MAG: hypothetical protein M1819_001636 [Sarea resinae]|nr:MAG: hypothetical protein M1819_001636 [Sarea resinae]